MESAQDTEARILAAAHRVFVRHGTAKARTQEIADEAGVNKALLHYYFGSKEKLAEAVFLQSARIIFPKLIQIMGSDMPLAGKVQAAVDFKFDVLEENPYLPGYLLSEFQLRQDSVRDLLSRSLPMDQLRDAVMNRLQSQLDAEADAGNIRRISAPELMLMLMSQIHFPFAAAPMLNIALGLTEDERAALMVRHRQTLAGSIMRSLATD